MRRNQKPAASRDKGGKSKKVVTTVKLQIPGGQRDTGAAGRPGARPARRQHHGVLQAVQRAHAAAGRASSIPVVITVYTDRSFTSSPRRRRRRCCSRGRPASRRGRASRTATRSARSRCAQVREIAELEDAGPERRRRRSRRADGRGHGAQHGHRGGGIRNEAAANVTTRRRGEDRPTRRTMTSRPRSAWSRRPPTAKFDETIELSAQLGVDPRHADQQVRGTVVLPHGTGRAVRVLVLARGEKEKEATEAGADFVGADEFHAQAPGGLDRRRRHHRDPRPHGRGRQAGPHARTARPDAQSRRAAR